MESAKLGLVILCILAFAGCVRDEAAVTNTDPGGGNPPPSGFAVTAPADMQAEATAAMSAVTLGQATTTGGSGQVSITSDAPASFPLGVTTVTWTATDASNAQATDTQQVTLVDTTAPSVTAPANVVASQTASLTLVTLGNATAADAVDAAPAMQNDAPAQGFPVGITTVTWTATDSSANAGSASQLVTINAMTPGSNLAIVAPGNVQQEGTGVLTAVALGQPTVTGALGNVTVANNAPAVGFPLGSTMVTWTATDSTATAMAAQLVSIADTTAPSITAPTDIVVDENGNPTMVSLGNPIVADLVDANPAISNDAPVAGFPVGTTLVTWTATDASANSGTATQNVTVNRVAAACSTHEAEFATVVYPILDSPARCQNCHTPNNIVVTANGFNMLANDTTGFDLFRAIAAIDSGGQSVMLVKPLDTAGHGGGDRFPVNGVNDPDYQAIESLVNKLAICVPDAPPPAQGVQIGSGYEQLYKVTMAVANRIPTVAETAQVDAAADDVAVAAALSDVLDSLMTEEAFYDRVKEIYNDLLLTDADATDRGGPDNNFELREFAATEQYYDAFNADRKEDANYGLARAPLELIEYVIKTDRPFNEIMTADYTMVNPYSAVIFGVDAGDPSFPFSSDTNPANHDRDDFRPVTAITQDDGDVVPAAGVLSTHAFLARIPSTNTNVNRARARWAFYYFLGVDIEGLAPRDGLDLDNVIGDVPTLEDPQCTVCHNIMDPVAGLFKNRANGGRYAGDVTWHNERFTNGVQRMLDPGYTMNPADALPVAEEATALQWFAMRVAQDDRFAQTTVRTIFEGLTGIEATAAGTTTFLNGLKDDFVANSFDFKLLVKGIATSPYLLARNLAAAESPASFVDIGSALLLTPEQLERKMSAVTGGSYSWQGPNSNSGLLGRHELLYGGIDSRSVVVRTRDPNAMITGIQRRIASQAACERVADNLRNGGVLFPIATETDVPTDSVGATRIQQNIQFLHRHLLGEDLAIDDAEVLATYQLFQDVRVQGDTAIPSDCRGGGGATDPNGTVLPWMAVVTYLLSDFSFLYQ